MSNLYKYYSYHIVDTYIVFQVIYDYYYWISRHCNLYVYQHIDFHLASSFGSLWNGVYISSQGFLPSMQFQKLLAIAFFRANNLHRSISAEKNPNLKYWTGWKKVDVWIVGCFFVNISEIKGICSAFLRTLSPDMLQCVIFPKGHIFSRTVSNEMQQRSICISPKFKLHYVKF